MKTKFIKVSTADRLPEESTELWFYCNDGYCNAGDYNKEMNRFTDVDGLRYSTEYIDYWLEENPDYEEEMKEVLLQLVGCHTCGHEIPDWLNDDAEELLTKLKTKES